MREDRGKRRRNEYKGGLEGRRRSERTHEGEMRDEVFFDFVLYLFVVPFINVLLALFFFNRKKTMLLLFLVLT